MKTSLAMAAMAATIFSSAAVYAATPDNTPAQQTMPKPDEKPSLVERTQGQAPGGGNQRKGRDMQKEYGLKKNNANSGGSNAGTATGGAGGDGQSSGAGGG